MDIWILMIKIKPKVAKGVLGIEKNDFIIETCIASKIDNWMFGRGDYGG